MVAQSYKAAIAAASKSAIDAIIQATTAWLEFADKESGTQALDTLFRQRTHLSLVMDRQPTGDIYRGIVVDVGHKFARESIVTYRPRAVASAWSYNFSMARSFATSPAWRDRIGATGTVGVVLHSARKEIAAKNVLVVPPAQTAAWFEKAIRTGLSHDAVGERKKEREIVVAKSLQNVLVLEQIDLAKSWGCDLADDVIMGSMSRTDIIKETELGNLIRRLREAADISTADMAEAAGISTATMNDIETGRIERPPNVRLLAIARMLDVTLNRLLQALPADQREEEQAKAKASKARMREAVKVLTEAQQEYRVARDEQMNLIERLGADREHVWPADLAG